MPQTKECSATASPNSVFEIPQSASKLFENKPKVYLTPIEALTTKHAATKVINASLFGKNFLVISFSLKLVLNLKSNLLHLLNQHGILQCDD